MQQYKHNKHKIHLFIHAIILVKLAITGCICLQFIVSLITYYSTTTTIHPTSLPWIETKSDCEHQDKTWHSNKCWDAEHSMMF
ncbi:hypothetical protein NIES4101_42460 [Calothrix sp. NIES-4101]|nr:hypothetical protein NIES4101_42460 [Calothrix sp. NIES-4101]